MRSKTDLESDSRKMFHLKERQKMDLAEEIEKVEIDIRKCASQLGYKRERRKFV